MSEAIQARFLSQSFKENSIFNLDHAWNRDNCFQPYFLLKETLRNSNIEINTVDVADRNLAMVDLHLDVQEIDASRSNYLLMLETPQVCLENNDTKNWDRYRKIFTWNDDLVDGDRFIKINFPNQIQICEADGFSNRDRFCCMISSNRALAVQDERILYPERIRVVRWFEQHAPHDFDLYGIGWDIPASRGGLIGKFENRFWRLIKRFIALKPFPSFRGKIDHKREVLSRTRFSICYENVCDLPGYITEKIFDCFFSGCVPIYWGASNITAHIPANCFIDRQQFGSMQELYDFLKSVTEQEYRGYQQNIAAFLNGDKAYPFSSEYFANTITETIEQDIGSQK